MVSQGISYRYILMGAKTHIALVSVPVYSHLLCIVEFSKRLLHLHQDFHFTCIIPTLGSPGNATKTLLEALPSSIDYIFLPPPNLQDLPEGTHPALLVELTISRSLPSIYEELKKLLLSSNLPLVAVISDALVNELPVFVKDLNILSYVYFPSTAMMVSLCLYSSKLDETVSCEYRYLPEPIEIPGCFPVHGSDLPDPFQDRSSEAYQEFLQAGKKFHLADGIIVNSFIELEPGAIRALEEEGRENPSVYPIGPIVQSGPWNQEDGSECLTWLDKKPPNSVLYVSFGSGGTLPHDQLNELALGLELSGQSFLWVFKPPSKFGIVADLSAENEDPLHFLPSGFLQRTKERGLVVPFWAPQVDVLSHSATGGFLCHCGWNSTLESIVHGVPLIAWPLFAEQKMNAAMLSDGLKVALRPKVNDEGIVEKEEIAKLMKSLIEDEEGKGIRRRMIVLKDAAADALEEDGSSTRTLSQLALRCRSFGGR